MSDVLIRPLRVDDLVHCERVSAHSYHGVDLRHTPRSRPVPASRSEARGRVWMERTGRLLAGDPGGGWAAETGDGELVGFATSFIRESLWVLASFAVTESSQGRGIGRSLLERALAYGEPCPIGMLTSSADPRALRRYHSAGFAMVPQLVCEGTVDRSRLPAVRGVREGSAADVEWMDALDRTRRGAGHGPDHDFLLASTSLIVLERGAERGYAYLDGTHPAVLAATSEEVAADLLWESLARMPDDRNVALPHITAANPWALDVALTARLDPWPSGYIGTRGMGAPTAYVHHGSLL